MTQVYHHKLHEKQKSLWKSDIHSKRWKNDIDRLVYIIGFIGIILAIPQVLKIFLLKDASGLSFIFWVTYVFTALFWTLYGIAHRSIEITLINICWFILDIAVVVGIVMYGNGYL